VRTCARQPEVPQLAKPCDHLDVGVAHRVLRADEEVARVEDLADAEAREVAEGREWPQARAQRRSGARRPRGGCGAWEKVAVEAEAQRAEVRELREPLECLRGH
jgi:hypothetical protein